MSRENSMRLSQLDVASQVLFIIEDEHKNCRCGGQYWMRTSMITKEINYVLPPN